MIIWQFPPKQSIIESLKINYGISCASLTSIHGGADLNAQVFKAEVNKHSSYFVKIKRGLDHNIGVSLQLLLHNAGIKQIIAPIKTIDNQSFQSINDLTLIVYPFINGQNGFDRSLTKHQWIEFGKAIKQIHEFDVPLVVKEQMKREDYSAKWRESVRSIYKQIDTEISNDFIRLALITFLKKQKEIILRLVDTADKLAQKIKNKNSDFILCHSDIHAGNILIQDDGEIFVVDWDSPIMAPKERDLMFIGGGVGNVWNNSEEVEFFYQGYGKTIIDSEILAYYRCERIVEDIAIYCQDLLSSNAENREKAYRLLANMFKKNGVVDIALET